MVLHLQVTMLMQSNDLKNHFALIVETQLTVASLFLSPKTCLIHIFIVSLYVILRELFVDKRLCVLRITSSFPLYENIYLNRGSNVFKSFL